MLINGKNMDIKIGTTISQMLSMLNLCADNVVVEVNFEIIQKANYVNVILNESDKVEIVSFVGGG